MSWNQPYGKQNKTSLTPNKTAPPKKENKEYA